MIIIMIIRKFCIIIRTRKIIRNDNMKMNTKNKNKHDKQ